MVQNLIDQLSDEVIKVTIKDKPNVTRSDKRSSPNLTDHRLKAAFDVLKFYALKERRVRQLRVLLNYRYTRRLLESCFNNWRNEIVLIKKKSSSPSKTIVNVADTKIELLINVVAKKQRELRESNNEDDNDKSRKRKSKHNRSIDCKTIIKKQTKCIIDKEKKQRINYKKQILTEQQERRKLRAEEIKKNEESIKEIDMVARRTSKKTIEVAKRALDQCDDQGTKRGIIHLMREQGCRDDMEIPGIPNPPKFLLRMEARAEARKERIKQVEEIRKLKREEQAKKEEADRSRIEEEQRQRQIKAQKEAIKARRNQETKRLKEIEKNERLERLANSCYDRYLFRRYVLEPLTTMIEEKRKILNEAQRHYELNLIGKVFQVWRNDWYDNVDDKLRTADYLYRRNLLWYNFDEWRNLAFIAKQKKQVAIDFYDMNCQRKCFDYWHGVCIEIKNKERKLEQKAKEHHEMVLRLRCFLIWKRYVVVANEMNKSEKRRNEWRDLIKKFAPTTPMGNRRIIDFTGD